MNFRNAVLAVLVIALVAASGGCGHHDAAPRHELSDRERDSIIATEKALPGSSVVGRALALSDKEAARAAAMNQQTQASESTDSDH